MIWKITHDESDVEHYLLGTMHLGSSSAYTYASLAKDKIAECSRYYGEMNLDGVDHQGLAETYAMQDGTVLSDMVGVRTYQRWKSICSKAFGLDLDSMQHLRPMLILNTIMAIRIGQGHLIPLDTYLWQYAKMQGLEMAGLESYETQRDLLLSLPIKPQTLMLKSSLRNVSLLSRKAKRLSAIYGSGDYQRLYKITAAGLQSMRASMLYDRNKQMSINIIMEMRSQESCFFAVGAAHVGGNYGIRAYLLRAGYRLLLLKH